MMYMLIEVIVDVLRSAIDMAKIGWVIYKQITQKEFNKHAINALALVEGQSYYTFNSSVYTEGFDTNYFKYNNLAAGALLSYGNASSRGSKEHTFILYGTPQLHV